MKCPLRTSASRVRDRRGHLGPESGMLMAYIAILEQLNGRMVDWMGKISRVRWSAS
jgi:hypothetical protein